MTKRSLIAIGLFALIGCAPGAPDASTSDGTWVGTITTRGNVTSVVNESGSVWGGTARLVEEMSIGVDVGPDEYMFGWISGLYATDDEIYVLDRQALELRVYDFSGSHLRTLGGEGQGPGEFTRPCYITGTPDGRIFVTAAGNNRINAYGADGAALPPLSLTWQECHNPFMATPDGTLWTHTFVRNEDFAEAIQAIGPAGPIGDPWLVPKLDYERWTFRFDGRDYEAVPFAPSVVWGILPGAMVVGTTDRYRFEIRRADGSATVIERFWEPVPVSDMERDYWTKYLPAQYSRAPLNWDGRFPPHKPAFSWFVSTYSDQVWVLRELEAEAIAGCDPDALDDRPLGPRPRRCFRATFVVDAFGADGKYLGEVETPGGQGLISFSAFIRGDTVIDLFEDEAGTIMVKRYRLVLPGEGDR